MFLLHCPSGRPAWPLASTRARWSSDFPLPRPEPGQRPSGRLRPIILPHIDRLRVFAMMGTLGRDGQQRGAAMPNLGALTEAKVRLRASDESFARGEEYLARGAVVRLERRGDQLLAEVEGSEYAPYRVTVTFDTFGFREAACTCPYDWGGDCKHIIAALLASLRSPEA